MKYTIESAPFSWRHVWIVGVASLGQMIGTAVATIASIIIPMIQIVGHPELASWEQGLLGAMDLIGIAIGATVLGKLSNRYGYLLFFRICPVIMLAGAVIAALVSDVTVTMVCLFVIGFAIGGEYSLDSDYISELMPGKWRSVMVGVSKASSALGNIIIAGVAFLLIIHWGKAANWPNLMWLLVVFSSVMILSRIYFAPSPKWLLEHGEVEKAQQSVNFFLGKNVGLDTAQLEVAKSGTSGNAHNGKEMSLSEFIKNDYKQIILTGIPWACEGLGVYGIGVFLPILVMALGLVQGENHLTPIMHVASSVEITFWISCLILPGFILGLLLMKRLNIITQLAWGFYLSAFTLLVLLLAFHFKWPAWLSVMAFMGFELVLNIGPHLLTYVLPPVVYPVNVRSLGSGLAASLGKVGAVLAVFFIPVILKSSGVTGVLVLSVCVMVIGGAVTSIFGPKVFTSLSRH